MNLPPVTRDEDFERLEKAKACLARLERIWPRPRSPDAEVPESIGRFRVLRELGRGGFGIVYLARDERLGREVALKVQRPEALISPSLRERFVREAKAAARLEHPNIAGMFEVGEAGFRIWIASEYANGGSLAQWLRGQPSPASPHTVAAFMVSLAEALGCAHRQGVLHRDLKPSNVLLQKNAGVESDGHALSEFTPKLIDFGLAKLDEASRHETRSGALIGTPSYMAPEQAAGKVRQIGPATDVYGLGTICFELLTGRQVFRGESDVHTLRQVAEDEPIRPRKLRGNVPADLEAICLKCLEKDPEKRYPTAEDLAADLRRYLSSRPTLARPLTSAERLVKWCRRRPALAGLVAVSIIAAVIVAVINVAYIVRLQQAKQTADDLRNEAEDSATTAQQQEELANRYLYAARMRMAYESLEQGDAVQVGRLLEPYEPPSHFADWRGFEWYYLKRRIPSERLSLSGHRGEVYRVIFSPDGRVLASGGQDGMIKLWDPTNGQELATLAGHQSCVNDLAYSLDGQTLVSVSCDHTIKVWSARTHELLATLERHPDEVRCVAFSPDGTRFATGGKGKLAVVWDFATLQVMKTTDAVVSDVDFLAWRDNRTLILPGDARSTSLGQGILWNIESDEKQLISEVGRSLAVSPDGLDVVLGMGDGTVRSIPEISARVAEYRGRGVTARTLAFSPDRNWLAVGYDDATVQVLDWPQARCRQTFPGHTARVQSVAFGPSGDQLASASCDGTVKIWSCDLGSAAKVQSSFFCLPASGPRHLLAISADLKYAALPGGPDQVQVFDLDQGQQVAALQTPGITLALSFSKADASVLYGYAPESQSVWKWNWRRDHLETIASTPPGHPEDATFLLAGRQLAIFPLKHSPSVYDTLTQEVWWKPNSNVPIVLGGITSSADEKMCAIYTLSGSIQGVARWSGELVDLNTKQTIYRNSSSILAVADGGRLIALGGGNPSTSILEVGRGADREICSLRPQTSVRALAFTPDCRTVATGGIHGGVQLWNVATGQLIARFETSLHPVEALRFSADGRRLLAMTFAASKDDGDGSKVQLYVWSGADGP